MAITQKQHINEIRKTKFSIGGDLNPLTEDLHQAVKNLSAELYAKDVHFLMELIQNAEDNEYTDGVEPSLEFVVTSKDITRTGALATLLIFNNEKGFTAKNIESICSVGRSTKKGNRRRGYIGEKGIGFKSVFLVTAQPYIFSNGYKIRFSEEPCPHCNVGYIVPEWVEENPTLSDINQIYGARTTLPTTTIVLPLKSDKVKPVKQQLSSIHPEVLLFLSKIKKLSVKEHNEDPRLNTVSAISISSDTNFVTRKNMDAESFTLHLSTEECSNISEKECSYYMWKQKFPVKRENRVDRRLDIEEWVITLAFPFGQRLHRGMGSPGVYAFLPTEMVTNLPFIIQADFLLASSRESILLDNKWNQGILDCVPIAFVNAFNSLVKTVENAPISSLLYFFMFLPVNASSYAELNHVRESIKVKLLEENIIPGQSYVEQMFFHKPSEVGRLRPGFWNILDKAWQNGVSLQNLSSHGRFIISCPFDEKRYDHILSFLGVEYVDSEWYAKCIQSSNIVLGVPEDVYLELLLFLAENWSYFEKSNMRNIPLLKYVSFNQVVSLCSIRDTANQNVPRNVLVSSDWLPMSWLIEWCIEFKCLGNHFFMPKVTQEAIHVHSKKYAILQWLKEWANIGAVTACGFANLIYDSISNDCKLLIPFAHFLFRALSNQYISVKDVEYLCNIMPLLDNYGHVRRQRKGVLVPANGSKWVQLMGSNPWRNLDFIELGEEYLSSGSFAGLFSPQNQLCQFLKTYVEASDIPDLSPPNAVIPTVSTPLTKHNVFLLLDWIQNLRSKRVPRPDRFLKSIKEGSFLKISLSGSPGYRPPSQSFMLNSSDGNLLQNKSVFVDIPLIDQNFYGDKINNYKQELKEFGVMFEIGEACQFIGKHLMSLADSSILTKANVFSILNFIKYLREKYLPLNEFINSIEEGEWMKTSIGYKSPCMTVLYNHEWKAASEISDIPFVDKDYYGEEINCFEEELTLLGVDIGFNENYQFVANCLKNSSHLTSLSADAVLLILQCIRHSESPANLVKSLKDTKFLKTNLGYKSPCECYLFDPEWGSLLQVFNCFPFIDQNIYGKNLLSYVQELKQLGVKVDFDEAAKSFAGIFRAKATSNGNTFLSIGKKNVLLLLACCRKLKKCTSHKLPLDLKKCLREVKWLRTRLGDYRPPSECILFGPKWESIAPITRLPFINDSEKYYGSGIHEYKEELKSMGVVVDFQEGVKFIIAGVYLPSDAQIITPANMISLLECIRLMLKDGKDPLPEAFMEKVSKNWIKTSTGYNSPNESLLLNSKWGSYLNQNDGPFIDNGFYGSDIMAFEKELEAIGVVVDVAKGGKLLSGHLCDHSDFTTIVRIYSYLSEVKWEASNEDAGKIWIPIIGSEKGKWASRDECVLHDKDGLFGSRFNVLEMHYERKLLSFFSSAFEVKSNPSLNDYCELWKVWESSGSPLSNVKCCAFWGYISKHWSSKTEKTLVDNLAKLPVSSSFDEILLMDKNDVFIADDLQLKDLFEQSSPHSIFVWYPRSSTPALPRSELVNIYRKIGVRTISESLVREELSIDEAVELKKVNPSKNFVGKQLVKLILGYLCGPSINMEAEMRHKAVECLINPTVLESVEPIATGYNLSLSSGEVISVKASRMIRWDREKSKFYMQSLNKSNGYKNMIAYATDFAEVISEGVLWENESFIHGLSELIKLAFMVEFDEEAVGFLMKNQNLLVFVEDEEFLSSAFPSE